MGLQLAGSPGHCAHSREPPEQESRSLAPPHAEPNLQGYPTRKPSQDTGRLQSTSYSLQVKKASQQPLPTALQAGRQNNFLKFTDSENKSNRQVQNMPPNSNRIQILLRHRRTFSRTDHMSDHKISLANFKKIDITASISSSHHYMKQEINDRRKADIL